MTTLGLSFGYHDSAIALVDGSQILFAAQEERFSRKKADRGFPSLALQACFRKDFSFKDVSSIAFYENSNLKSSRQAFGRKIAPIHPSSLFRRNAFDEVTKNSLVGSISSALGISESEAQSREFFWLEHHLSHAASAFLPSGLETSAILTIDGVGEWSTVTIGCGDRQWSEKAKPASVQLLEEMRFPNSIGLLYSAFTAITGFKINSGEYKLMGLAPYGKPTFKTAILDNLVDRQEDGSWLVASQVFDNWGGQQGFITPSFESILGVRRRDPDDPLESKHFDLAASIQSVLNEIVLDLAHQAVERTGSTNLCMAGGVALNCVANAVVRDSPAISNLWIQPAAGDAGGALGCALFIEDILRKKTKRSVGSHHSDSVTESTGFATANAGDSMQGAYLGPAYDSAEVMGHLQSLGITFEYFEDFLDLARISASELSNGLVIGWFQGRMEFGPRALGNRSILADPRSATMQSRLNLKTKFRESFRPFAPSVLLEHSSEFFYPGSASPYMLLVEQVRATENLDVHSPGNRIPDLVREAITSGRLPLTSSDLPAITHVDGSARVQTVSRESNARFYALINEFRIATGVPLLVNTSFNVRGEPIVCSVEDAVRCMASTDIDLLVIENCLIRRDQQEALHKLARLDPLPPD